MLTAHEPPPFRWYNPHGNRRWLITCDHAGARIPLKCAELGVSSADRAKHIGWDIGALALSRLVAERIDAPLVHSIYSRLVVDLNRYPDDPSAMPPTSDNVPIPGNQALDPNERDRRHEQLFVPYHRAIAEHLKGAQARDIEPCVVFIHSFTPHFQGESRPWPVGVLYNQDTRLAHPLLRELTETHGLEAGDNQPYSAMMPLSYSSQTHCEGNGLPYAAIEVRQDLLTTPDDVRHWASVLADALTAARGSGIDLTADRVRVRPDSGR